MAISVQLVALLALCIMIAGPVGMLTQTEVEVVQVDLSFIGTFSGVDSNGYSGVIIIEPDDLTIIDTTLDESITLQYVLQGDTLIVDMTGTHLTMHMPDADTLVVTPDGQAPSTFTRQ